jgi:hypothetical protein
MGLKKEKKMYDILNGTTQPYFQFSWVCSLTFAGMERTNVDMVQVFDSELNWVFGPVDLVGEQPDPRPKLKKLDVNWIEQKTMTNIWKSWLKVVIFWKGGGGGGADPNLDYRF